MNKLIKIRIIQLNRELKTAGFAWLFLIGVVAGLMRIAFEGFSNDKFVPLVPTVLLLVCFIIQISRPDLNFIYKHIEQPYKAIYLEYFYLILPFNLMALFTSNWYWFIVAFVLLMFVPLLKTKSTIKNWFPHITKIIPAKDFELISGFRKSFSTIILFYFLAVGLSWFRVAPLLLLWLITLQIVAFYTEGESLLILRENATSTKEFLLNKMQRHALYMIILYCPIIFINAAFNPEYWLINLLFIPFQVAILCCAICAKYAHYKPGSKIIAGNASISIAALSSIVPYLLPIPLFLAAENYAKARKHLKNYLND